MHATPGAQTPGYGAGRFNSVSAPIAKNRLGVTDSVLVLHEKPTAQDTSLSAFLKHESGRPAAEKPAAEKPAAKAADASVALAAADAQVDEAEAAALRMRQAASLVRLKRLDVRATAAAIGMPYENVRRALTGSAEAMRVSDWNRMMEIAGLDLETGRLNRSFPHFLHLTGASKSDLDCIAPLLADSFAARVDRVGTGLRKLFSRGPRVIVLQNAHVRVVCIDYNRIGVVGRIQDCRWARKTEKASVVPTKLAIDRFLSGDLTGTEFDELFDLEGKLTWDRIAMLARANHVSMEEIIDFIHERGDLKEQERLQRMRAVVNDDSHWRWGKRAYG